MLRLLVTVFSQSPTEVKINGSGMLRPIPNVDISAILISDRSGLSMDFIDSNGSRASFAPDCLSLHHDGVKLRLYGTVRFASIIVRWARPPLKS